MAMNFALANRAETAPIYDARIQQAYLQNALRQQEQARRMMYAQAGADLAQSESIPEGAWDSFLRGGAGTIGSVGAPAANATQAALGASQVSPLTGAVSSAVPGMESALLGGAMQSAAPTAALGAEAAGAAEAAMAANAAAGTTAGTGMGAALSALGPIGWGALLAFALGATDAL